MDDIAIRVEGVYKRFGTDTVMIPVNDNEFEITASIAVSPQFLAWVYGFGTEALIVSPQEVADKMKKQLTETAALYK